MNRITKVMPEETKIAGELKAMEKNLGYKSLIRWALENTPEKLAEWCQLEDDGSLSGPMAPRFEQAIRLEGTKSAQSKHAAGVVIAPEPLNQICPMILDTKEKKMIAGMEMNDLESIGMLKLDVLGVAMLDKVMGVQQILATGDVIE
jgi:DNA polymerase III alpha subunit